MPHTNDLFTAATKGSMVRRFDDMVMLVMPSMAVVVSQQDMQQAQTWARGKNSTGMPHKDREIFLGRMETVIARTNSGYATRGSPKAMIPLVKLMRASGTDLENWSIPRAVMDELFPSHGPAIKAPQPKPPDKT